jgi:hypothetical protein
VVLHVANPEACALLKSFAEERGVSLSDALKIAVREAREADRRDASAKAALSTTDIEPA